MSIGECHAATSLCPNDSFNLNCSVNKIYYNALNASLEWRIKFKKQTCRVIFEVNSDHDQNCTEHLSQEIYLPCRQVCKAQLVYSSSTYYHSVITVLHVEKDMKIICAHPGSHSSPTNTCITTLAGILINPSCSQSC